MSQKIGTLPYFCKLFPKPDLNGFAKVRFLIVVLVVSGFLGFVG